MESGRYNAARAHQAKLFWLRNHPEYGAAGSDDSDDPPARVDQGQAYGKSCLIVLVIVVVTGCLRYAYLTRGDNRRGF